MWRRDTLRLGLGLALCGTRLRPAWADYQTCSGEVLSDDEIRCPDGSIPSHSYGNPPAPTTPDKPNGKRTQSGNDRFIGVWHTPFEGVSYAHTYDVPGATSMTGKISLRPGDLTIDPEGAFVWNRLSAPFGRWIGFSSGKWDVLLIERGGANWHGKMMPDGHLKIFLDDTHDVLCTR